MKAKNKITEPETIGPEDLAEETEADTSPSVDDFIKELEAKEKDLHITADYQIEIADPDFDEASVPDFVQPELPVPTRSVSPNGSDSAGGMKTRVFELEREIETLKAAIAGLRMERNDVQQKSDRRLKDFENYKYRMDRERRGAFITQIGNLATQMLPVLDNLDRALDSMSEVPTKKRDEFKHFFDGIALVNQQINEVLSGMGVQPIATVGEPFDPNFHEAVATEEGTSLPPNTVSGEMRRGYRIGNLVIRHSMVKVTTASPGSDNAVNKEQKEEPQENSDIALMPEPADLLPEETPIDNE